MKEVIVLLALLVSSGYFINESYAEISENQAFLLEGSGFAVTVEAKANPVDQAEKSPQATLKYCSKRKAM